MTEDTVTVDGEEYIFPPNQTIKPEKTTEQEEDQGEDLLYDAQNGGLQ